MNSLTLALAKYYPDIERDREKKLHSNKETKESQVRAFLPKQPDLIYLIDPWHMAWFRRHGYRVIIEYGVRRNVVLSPTARYTGVFNEELESTSSVLEKAKELVKNHTVFVKYKDIRIYQPQSLIVKVPNDQLIFAFMLFSKLLKNYLVPRVEDIPIYLQHGFVVQLPDGTKMYPGDEESKNNTLSNSTSPVKKPYRKSQYSFQHQPPQIPNHQKSLPKTVKVCGLKVGTILYSGQRNINLPDRMWLSFSPGVAQHYGKYMLVLAVKQSPELLCGQSVEDMGGGTAMTRTKHKKPEHTTRGIWKRQFFLNNPDYGVVKHDYDNKIQHVYYNEDGHSTLVFNELDNFCGSYNDSEILVKYDIDGWVWRGNQEQVMVFNPKQFFDLIAVYRMGKNKDNDDDVDDDEEKHFELHQVTDDPKYSQYVKQLEKNEVSRYRENFEDYMRLREMFEAKYKYMKNTLKDQTKLLTHMIAQYQNCPDTTTCQLSLNSDRSPERYFRLKPEHVALIKSLTPEQIKITLILVLSRLNDLKSANIVWEEKLTDQANKSASRRKKTLRQHLIQAARDSVAGKTVKRNTRYHKYYPYVGMTLTPKTGQAADITNMVEKAVEKLTPPAKSKSPTPILFGALTRRKRSRTKRRN